MDARLSDLLVPRHTSWGSGSPQSGTFPDKWMPSRSLRTSSSLSNPCFQWWKQRISFLPAICRRSFDPFSFGIFCILLCFLLLRLSLLCVLLKATFEHPHKVEENWNHCNSTSPMAIRNTLKRKPCNVSTILRVVMFWIYIINLSSDSTWLWLGVGCFACQEIPKWISPSMDLFIQTPPLSMNHK